MIPLEEAQARVLAGCSPLAPRRVALRQALGLVIAEPVTALHSVPPFANTAMDGFAVRAADTTGAPVRLRVAGTLAAGADPSSVAVRPGEAVRIMTGAAIPEGADAIVMVERTQDLGDEVEIEVTAQAGDHFRAAGGDIAGGDEVFPAGTVLGSGHLGVIASVGASTVLAHPPARVGVMSTGDELVEEGELAPGQIRDSNRPSLLALVERAGCEAVDLGVVRDDETSLRTAFEQAVAGCDAVITSGGVSMGEFDYVKRVLAELSSDSMVWMQVAIRPAKPLSFGVVGGVPVFGLPGNPVSSIVSFELFARPALRKMMGHRELHRPPVAALADEDLRRAPDGKTHFARVTARFGEDGRVHVRSAGGQASNQLKAMALADGLAVLPDGDGVRTGDAVAVMLTDCG